jgi:hypothetical protein
VAGILDRKAGKDRVWIKAGYAPDLLKAIRSRKKKWETIPQALARAISLALAKADQPKRKKRFSQLL